MCNARYVEDGIACERFNYFNLGRKLWRIPGMGARFGDLKEKKVHKVGITYHYNLQPLIDEGRIIVNM